MIVSCGGCGKCGRWRASIRLDLRGVVHGDKSVEIMEKVSKCKYGLDQLILACDERFYRPKVYKCTCMCARSTPFICT